MNRTTWIAAACAGLLLVGGAGWLAYHRGDPLPPGPNVPTVSLPAEVAGDVGAFVRVPSVTTCKYVRWYVADAGLNLFPVDLMRDSGTAVVTASKPGRFRLMAYAAAADVPTEPAQTVVVIGAVPPEPVPPGPVPPGPTPPVPPAPIPGDGLRVLIVFDAAQAGKLPKDQELILYAQALRQYLDSKCPAGADGKTKEYRIWPSGADVSQEAKLWQDAYARPRQSSPWIIVSNGAKGGFEGPLPGNVDDTLALIKKYAEPQGVR